MDEISVMRIALAALRELSDQLGGDDFFNEGGDGYEACEALREKIHELERQ
jgi:hypothetical protein